MTEVGRSGGAYSRLRPAVGKKITNVHAERSGQAFEFGSAGDDAASFDERKPHACAASESSKLAL